MGQLFRWVAWFTGSKNATKGAGFFIGGFLLQVVGFRPALWLMAAMLAIVLVGVMLSLPRTLGKAKASKSFRELFAKTRAINLIAAARVFMFGSRDVWFVVGLPVYLYGFGWQYMQVAGFIAAWTIGYGAVQALAPQVVTRSRDGLSREVPAARLWGGILTVIPVVLALLLTMPGVPRRDLILVIGLLIFGFVFAVISSLHSYLILAYAGSEKAAEDVGFYYAANAAGRLMGNHAVRHPDRDRRDACLPVGFRNHAGDLPWLHHPLALGRRSPACARMSVSESSTVAGPAPARKPAAMGTFERYLTVWVALCIIAGIILGQMAPGVFHLLGDATVAQVNLPVAVLVWLMIVPMLLKIDLAALRRSKTTGAASPRPSASIGW